MSSSAKILIVGGLAAVAALALIGGAASASSSKAPGVPPPPKPGPGATVENLQAGIAQGVPALKRTTWRVPANASGQQAGLMILIQVASSPNRDWVLLFKNDQSQGVGVLGYSQTPLAGLIAQQLAAGL